MRRLAAAALALSASACCLDVGIDDACVVSRLPARPYCYPMVDEEPICTYEEDEAPTRLSYDGRTCEGTLHEDDTCEDHGFTERCPGDYFVRPGTGC